MSDACEPLSGLPTGGLAIVVVNYGSHELLAAHLATIVVSGGDVHVIVVDNFTDEAERSRVTTLCATHRWSLVPMPVNVGFGAAVNAGARRAGRLGCTGLLLLNPDAWLSGDTVAALHAQIRAEPLTAVCPLIVTPRGDVEFRGSQVQLSDGRIRGIRPHAGGDGLPRYIEGQVPGQLRGPVQGWLTGACLAIDLVFFDRLGGFDERYFLYWEDVDLSRRIELGGGRLLVRQDLRAVHEQGSTHGTAGSRARSATYYYFNCRNRLTFAAQHLPRRAVLRWILSTPAQSRQILLRGGRRQLLHSPRPWIATLRGSAAGVAGAIRALLHIHPPARRPPQVLVAHPGAELYGSDRMLLEAVDGFVSAGMQTTVALRGGGPLVAELTARGALVRLCRFPVLRKSALRPLGLFRLVADTLVGLPSAVRLIRAHASAGLYVSTTTIPSWLVLGRILRRPVTCHVHEAERAAPRPLRLAMALPLLCAHRIVVNSGYSLDVLCETLPRLRARSSVVYNGVTGPAHVDPVRRVLRGPVRLLFVGRLSPRKGPDVALRALRELTAHGVAAHLTLLGAAFTGYDWFEAQLHRTAAQPDLSGSVSFLGFEADVWPRYAEADIVLIPSVVDEPFGNTAVEAMLAARPAVVSATSGLREAADGYRSALLVKPDDPAALCAAVTRIVAQWAVFVEQAENDAVQACERHSPLRYRDDLVAVLTAARVA